MNTCPLLKLCSCTPDEICLFCKVLTAGFIALGCGIVGYIIGKNVKDDKNENKKGS